jgi:hypothetical protein
VQQIWYVAYGSNLSRARFQCYLTGGRPVGGARRNPGCRDSGQPVSTVGVRIPGRIWFAGVSSVWGGGMAFFDPSATGEVLARAYLLTSDQFADVLAQELRRAPGAGLDLTPLHRTGRHTYGPGGYETLVRVGTRKSVAMVTLTCDSPGWRTVNAPSAAYLRTMALGLREAHGLSPQAIADYVCAIPSAAGDWSSADVADLVA